MKQVDKTKVNEIMERWGYRKDCLIEMLHDIQEEYNYLPKEVLLEISRNVEIPLARIVGIATFYKRFSLIPRGKHCIGVCMGTPCHAKGAPLIVEALERHLGIKEGESTKDLEYYLEITGCVGTCGLAPVVVIDEEMYGDVSASGVKRMLKKFEQGEKT